MPDPLPRVNPRTPVTAEAWNRLVDAIESVNRFAAEVGRDSRRGVGSLRVDIARALDLGERLMVGTITAVPPPVVPDEPGQPRRAWLPSQVRYFAQADYAPSIVVDGLGDGALPAAGREVEGDECRIYPARVGDRCLIVREPDPASEGGFTSLLWVLTEKVARRRCTGGG